MKSSEHIPNMSQCVNKFISVIVIKLRLTYARSHHAIFNFYSSSLSSSNK